MGVGTALLSLIPFGFFTPSPYCFTARHGQRGDCRHWAQWIPILLKPWLVFLCSNLFKQKTSFTIKYLFSSKNSDKLFLLILANSSMDFFFSDREMVSVPIKHLRGEEGRVRSESPHSQSPDHTHCRGMSHFSRPWDGWDECWVVGLSYHTCQPRSRRELSQPGSKSMSLH